MDLFLSIFFIYDYYFLYLQVNINKQKKDAFQILKPDLDVDPEYPHFDARMGINKTKLLRPKRMSFQFVEEGKWSKEAEHIKLKVFTAFFEQLYVDYVSNIYSNLFSSLLVPE